MRLYAALTKRKIHTHKNDKKKLKPQKLIAEVADGVETTRTR
jgi:hypothetical protein